MPAASRAGDRRPSAATASDARDLASVGQQRAHAVSARVASVSTSDFDAIRSRDARQQPSQALRSETLLGMFSPKWSSPISLARKVTTGLRISRWSHRRCA